MKRIYRYATWAEVPKGGKYLGSIAQTEEVIAEKQRYGEYIRKTSPCFYVWHYYEVEVGK